MENSEDKFESQINDAHSDMSMKHSARKDGYVEAEMSHLSHRKIEEDKHDDSDTLAEPQGKNLMTNKYSKKKAKKTRMMGKKAAMTRKPAQMIDIDKMLEQNSNDSSIREDSKEGFMQEEDDDKIGVFKGLGKRGFSPKKKEMNFERRNDQNLRRNVQRNNIQMKRVRRDNTEQNYGGEMRFRNRSKNLNYNRNIDYQRNFSNMDQMFDRNNLGNTYGGNMQNIQNFQNMPNIPNMPNMPNMMDNMANNYIDPMARVSDYNSVANSNIEQFDRGAFDPFQNLLNQKLRKQMSSHRPKTIKEIDSESIMNAYENLTYGSSIFLAIENGPELKKLSTKLRVSDKVNAEEMEKDQYNINCIFRIVPSCQHIMQDKILDIIDDDKLPLSIEIEYENFISEMESNTASYKLNYGKSVKFEDNFQLYQDSSKRFLCFSE